MGLIKICNKIIEYSFYALFLIVPWALWKDTSELFELNKMWLTWGLTIIICTAWLTKMILQRRIFIERTPLDIPIALFLVSQIISTIFSLDSHVSFWGYYSRFNGGLLSIISYILLYYAFLSNSPTIAKVQRLMAISLISGLIVAIWGLPSHFGYDPTCLLFRGTFDVSCWTANFMPKIRMFSTLGQPDWLAAYLAILIPIAIAFFINNLKSNLSNDNKYHVSSIKYYVSKNSFIHNTYYILLATLFYVDLLFTRARSGIIGVWLSLIFFAIAYIFMVTRDKKQEIRKSLLLIPCLLLLITFIIGTPINQLNRFTLVGIGSYFQKTQIQKNSPPPPTQPHEPGGTESADIRLNVWRGAINAWRANPIIGSGVETFAFAYYKYKPAAQNLTSEWDYLYNKAHNEYLNYLATTGIVGLGTYLSMIIICLWLCIKHYVSSIKKGIHNTYYILLNTGLLAGYVSILITNFFGFSVVITNIYLFMIPAFVFVLNNMIKDESKDQRLKTKDQNHDVSIWQWTPIFFLFIISCFLLITLFRFWRADIAYALGYNLDRAGEYQQAYPALHKAVELRGDELVFKDELSINNAIIATGLLAQLPSDDKKEQTISLASALAREAINTSNEIVSKSPNNAVFWKTRVRLFYTLSQVDSKYLPRALDAIEKASLLAPADANIWYNLGVLYGQNNNIKKGIEALEKTVKLRPNYRDAHYALGLYYRTASLDEAGKVIVNETLNQKAIAQMKYILDHLNPQDPGAKDSIKSWGG